MLPVSGTLLNIATVLVGAVLGLLVGGRLPERFNGIILGGLGLSVLVVGMQNALLTDNILILIGSVLRVASSASYCVSPTASTAWARGSRRGWHAGVKVL